MKNKIFLLAFVFCLMFTSMAFAVEYPSNLPPVPTEFSAQGTSFTTEDYFIFTNKDNNTFVVLLNNSSKAEGNFTNTINSSNNNIQVTHSSGNNFAYALIRYKDGAWGTTIQVSSGSASTEPTQKWSSTFLYSTFDLKDENGEVFFTAPVKGEPPLHQTIQKVTEEGLATELNLAGTIRILVLCGVGLIASLMALNLFWKVFNHYRS